MYLELESREAAGFKNEGTGLLTAYIYMTIDVSFHTLLYQGS